jgi:transcription antitermination protein NusB
VTSTPQRPSDAKPSSAHDPSKGSRARGRELGLWVLCHLESHPGAERDAVELFWREPPAIELGNEFLEPIAQELVELLGDGQARRFAKRLVDSYLDHASEIDTSIDATSARWRLVRMDRVDRNLLRLAAVELGYLSIGQDAGLTPRNVVVAEAVRLAARYGSERSPTFVNGLAEALARDLRDEPPPSIDAGDGAS